MRLALALLWICTSVSVAAAQGAQETRVALVIGNGAYTSVDALGNPVRDAMAVAKALREAGFQSVQVETNLGHDAMLKALRRFEEAADKADWALVYYAGHGIETGGSNYLVPVDAQLKSDRDVDEEAVALATVQKRLEGARKLRLVILDACRSNPFLAKMRRMQVASRSVGRGLAVPDLPQAGSLVAYAAAAGQVALDEGTAAGNSPYAAALVKNLTVPDVEVNLFFRRVRVDVMRATGNKQEPATYEALSDDRYVFNLGQTAALTTIAPLPTLTSKRKALVEICDRLTASPFDFDKPAGVSGVAFEAVDSGSAIAACRAALATWSDLPTNASVAQVAVGTGSEELELRRTLFQLGRALEGVKLYGEARALYEQAATMGNVHAMATLGLLYAQGQGGAKDYSLARKLFEKAVSVGNPVGMAGLSALYAGGWGVTQDYGAARGWAEKAAGLGNYVSMDNLGTLYLKGWGVGRDYGVARSWFEKAAAAGYPAAMINLGTLYLKGWGVAQDYGAARRWYEKAAAAGNAAAMAGLGILYVRGWGVAQDYATARGWYEKAAVAGDADGMAGLGYLYTMGQGVTQDYGAARGWLEKAAAAGNAGAMVSLGTLYASGWGVAQDYAAARRWLEKAAAAGSTTAMNTLASLYTNGLGVPRNQETANMWLKKAGAEAGSYTTAPFSGRAATMPNP